MNEALRGAQTYSTQSARGFRANHHENPNEVYFIDTRKGISVRVTPEGGAPFVWREPTQSELRELVRRHRLAIRLTKNAIIEIERKLSPAAEGGKWSLRRARELGLEHLIEKRQDLKTNVLATLKACGKLLRRNL